MARRKILSISHNDLDGVSCSILLKYLMSDYADIIQYNVSPARLYELMASSELVQLYPEIDQIFITDISVAPNTIAWIEALGLQNKTLIFDHHQSILSPIPDYARICKYANNDPDTLIEMPESHLTCATMIFWNYLRSFIRDHSSLFDPINAETVAKIWYYVTCVECYDTFAFWDHQMNGTTEEHRQPDATNIMVDAPRLNTIFHMMEPDDFEHYITTYFNRPIMIPAAHLTKGFDTGIHNYSWIDMVITIELKRNAVYNEQALRRMNVVKFAPSVYINGLVNRLDYTCGVIFVEKNGPAIGHMACDRNPGIDFCAIVSNNQVSLYTTKESVNVGKIAQMFHGNGHDKAAGFTISYQSANILNTNHFFDIVGCAGNILYSSFEMD